MLICFMELDIVYGVVEFEKYVLGDGFEVFVSLRVF